MRKTKASMIIFIILLQLIIPILTVVIDMEFTSKSKATEILVERRL